MERSDASTNQDRQVMTGAQALVRALEDIGVTDIFGIPGGGILNPATPLSTRAISNALVVGVRTTIQY